MKFDEILKSFTGFSVPIFGIQWQPPIPQVKIARNVLRVLEDKRVLYMPFDSEGAHHCLNSVFDLREVLSTAMQSVESKSPLYNQLQKMRRACRSFCNVIGSDKFDTFPIPIQRSLLVRELTKLRSNIGSAVGEIVIAYGVALEDELASIVPFNNVGV